MKKSSEYKDPFMTSKVDDMVAKLRAAGHTKRVPTKVQSANTQKLLEAQQKRKPEDDWKYLEDKWSAPYPVEAIAHPEVSLEGLKGKALDDAIAKKIDQRQISPEEHALIHGMRQRGHDNVIGQSEKSATSPEKRESAIHHFMVSGSVKAEDVDPTKVVGLQPIKSELPPPEKWVEVSWPKALYHWITGQKVRRKND